MEPRTTDLLSLAEFYSADAETLRLKYNQVEKLIGLGHHSPSEGDYCEALLTEFLPGTPIATPQLDIIVHDSTDYAPLFRSEDFVVDVS